MIRPIGNSGIPQSGGASRADIAKQIKNNMVEKLKPQSGEYINQPVGNLRFSDQDKEDLLLDSRRTKNTIGGGFIAANPDTRKEIWKY